MGAYLSCRGFRYLNWVNMNKTTYLLCLVFNGADLSKTASSLISGLAFLTMWPLHIRRWSQGSQDLVQGRILRTAKWKPLFLLKDRTSIAVAFFLPNHIGQISLRTYQWHLGKFLVYLGTLMFSPETFRVLCNYLKYC